MFFLTLSRTDIWFAKREFTWKTYMAAKALPMTKQVEIIRKKGFVVTVQDADEKIFVIHVITLAELIIMLIYLFCKVQVASLTSTEIFVKYSNFLDVFSLHSVVKLLEKIGIHDHSINWLKVKQMLYGLIYNLEPVELETLKSYINVNIASGFIKISKTSTSI